MSSIVGVSGAFQDIATRRHAFDLRDFALDRFRLIR
jgi:hypothetical protein